MSSATIIPKTAESTAPADLETKVVIRDGEREVDFGTYRPVPETEVTIELEYATTTFPLEGDRKLFASKPLRFAYVDDQGTVEIVGWDLKVNLEEAKDLPRQISRRFLELFSKSQAGELSEQEDACFEKICEQIDYRRFSAERDRPRYMEALLMRKSPALIRYLGDRIRLDPEVARQLELLDEGEYFGAYLTLDRKGEITGISNVVFVPSPETVLADDNPADYAPCEDDFPESLKMLFPYPGKKP